MSRSVASSSDRSTVRSLRSVVLADAAVTGAAACFTITMALFVVQESILLGLGFVVAGGAVVLVLATRPLRRDDIDTCVLMFAVTNWTVAVSGAVVATFSWPLCLLGALLPGVVAASFVIGDRITIYVVGSFVSSLLVAAAGLLQDVTGLSDRVPSWLQTTVLVGISPLLGAMVVLVALQHQRQLRQALDDEFVARLRLADQADELQRSRQRVVAATDRERRRIERDLHDGAQSRLIGISFQLAAARTSFDRDPTLDQFLVDLREEVLRAHRELRELAHGLYPPELEQHGVEAAVQSAAERSRLPVRISVDAFGRCAPDVESAVYFCILEAIVNAQRHANATTIDVRLTRDDEAVEFVVSDDGAGMSSLTTATAAGHGLQNMRDRMGAVGGTLAVFTKGGTTVRGRVPH